MIKVTHFEKTLEPLLAEKIAKFIKREFPSYYFEVKVYGDGVQTSPTLKITKEEKP